jgi:hypothetical protein
MGIKHIAMIEYNRSINFDGMVTFDSRIIGESYPREDNSGVERTCVNIVSEYAYGKLLVTVLFDNLDEQVIHEGICQIFYQLNQ